MTTPIAPELADTTQPPEPRLVGRRRPRGSAPSWVWVLGGVAGFVAIWWTIAALRIWDPVFVPPPSAVWDRLVETSTTHDGEVGHAGYYWWQHLAISLRRILLGTGLAALLGIPIGLLIGTVAPVRHALGPAITFLRQLPPLAYFSLLIIWFGIDETPKVVLLVVAAMPPIIVATATGLEGIPRDTINAARSLGAGRLQLVRHILLPGALPDIFTGVRLGVGVAYTSVVAAETVNGLPGIGGMIRDAQRYNQTDAVILGILLLGLTGLLLEAALQWAQRRATPWRSRA